MSADVDADTLAGITAVWTATDAAAVALALALPVERLTSDYTPMKKGEPIAYPYADVVVTQSRPGLYQAPVRSGSAYLDYRKVIVTVRDVGKAKVGQHLAKLRDVFAESRSLSVGNGTWKRTLRQDDRVEREKDRRFGEDVYRGVLQLEIWSERSEP